MKKRMAVLSILTALLLTGCTEGERLNDATGTKSQKLINWGSMYVYTFRDEKTGVWYIVTDGGITTRLESDGSLYVGDE